MGSDDFTTVGSKQRRPTDWLCRPCGSWNSKKNECCFRCKTPKHKKAELWGDRSKSHGGGGGGAGSKQSKSDAEIDRRIDLLTKQVEKLTKPNGHNKVEEKLPANSVPTPAGAPDVPENLVSELKCIESDQKMVAVKLKERPGCPRMLQWASELKATHESVKKRLRDSQDPDEQVQNKGLRLNRLKELCETDTAKLREACLEEEEAGKRAGALCAKIKANKVEIERLRAESRLLQNGRPADMATVVESMRLDYEQHFANPALSEGISGRKAEVEAAFVSIANLLQQLAAFDVTLKACTKQAATAAASSASLPAQPNPTAALSGLQVALSSTGAGGQNVVDARETGQKAVRDSTDEELTLRTRAVRTRTCGGGEVANQAWEQELSNLVFSS